jgi:putative transposase
MSEFKRVVLNHTPPDWVENGSLFFLTVCCKQRGENQLCNYRVAETLFDSAKFYASSLRWLPRLILLMPDHCHALASFPSDSSMSRVIGDWKRYTAKMADVSWQRGFFDHRIRNDENWEEKASYIRLNPVRAGLVAKPEQWPWVLEAI